MCCIDWWNPPIPTPFIRGENLRSKKRWNYHANDQKSDIDMRNYVLSKNSMSFRLQVTLCKSFWKWKVTFVKNYVKSYPKVTPKVTSNCDPFQIQKIQSTYLAQMFRPRAFSPHKNSTQSRNRFRFIRIVNLKSFNIVAVYLKGQYVFLGPALIWRQFQGFSSVVYFQDIGERFGWRVSRKSFWNHHNPQIIFFISLCLME